MGTEDNRHEVQNEAVTSLEGRADGSEKAQEPEKKRGWGPVRGSSKWHYFQDTRSLCGAYGFRFKDDDLEDHTDGSADNCKACQKKVAKLREREAKAKAAQS